MFMIFTEPGVNSQPRIEITTEAARVSEVSTSTPGSHLTPIDNEYVNYQRGGVPKTSIPAEISSSEFISSSYTATVRVEVHSNKSQPTAAYQCRAIRHGPSMYCTDPIRQINVWLVCMVQQLLERDLSHTSAVQRENSRQKCMF